MSKLSAFLNPVAITEEKEVIVSKRFQDEKGNPVPFRIRALTQEENDAIVKRCQGYRKVNGQNIEHFDNLKYTRELVVTATLEPDFRDAELCKKYGVADPAFAPGKMLLSGEYAKLVQAITELSGFDDGSMEEDAKN